jgi:uncharacterized protein YjbI with pentapeptide repeats
VVVGLDDSGSEPRGALYIYDVGAARLKLGEMDGLPAVGTVTPSGWGIWTDNGYFQGQVAASTIYGSNISGGTITGVQVTGNYIDGGTITGALVSGGTVSGGRITGGTVTGALVSGGTVAGALVYGGTVRTSANPVNSSNPGVMMDATGLIGYGTLGVTFKLPTDPADRPLFSSGTILNTVYEVYSASIIRTGTANPRVQMDSSGIFGYGPTGATKFSLDATTGQMTASDGAFSGAVSASTVTGGTVTGSRITGGTITGVAVAANSITGGTVNGAQITGGTITGVAVAANSITGGTVTGSRITGGTITGVAVTANSITGGTVSGAVVSGNSISGGTVTGSRITGGTITGVAVTANTISGGTVSGALVTAGTVSGAQITGGTAQFPATSGTARLDGSRGFGLYMGSVVNAEFGLDWLDTGGGAVGMLHMANRAVGREMRLTTSGSADIIALQAGVTGHYLVLDVDGIANYDLRPNNSLARSLGDSSHGWRYLYLTDNFLNVRRLEINNGTVLIT